MTPIDGGTSSSSVPLRLETSTGRSSLLDRAERDGLFDVAYANVDSHSAGFSSPGPIAVSSSSPCPATRGRVSEDEVLDELATQISPRVFESLRLDEERRELDDYFDGEA